MARCLKLILQVGIVSVSLSAAVCLAKGDPMNTDSGDSHEQSWNREQKSSTKQESLAIVQQKAQVRAEQRNYRMASSAWYGITNGRPSGSSTPFTSRYGSLWEMPGGQPYSWNPPGSRPNYVILW